MPFDFNLFSSLLLPALIQGILFSGLLFIRFLKNGRLHNIFLALLLSLLSVRISYWMLGFAGWYDTHDLFTEIMFYFPFNTLLLIGPTIYFYFLSLTNSKFRIQKKHWPHFVLPAGWLLLYIIKLIADFVFYYPFPQSEEFQYGTKGPFAEIDKSTIFYALSYLSLAYYLVVTLKSFSKYYQYLSENFSTTNSIDFKWFFHLLIVLSSGLLVTFLFVLYNFFSSSLSYTLNWYPYLVLGIVIYYVSIQGYFNDSNLMERLQFMQPESSIGVGDKLGLADLDLWKEKLVETIESDKIFLKHDLSLSDVANTMKTSSQVVSKTINEGFGQNFNEFINQYRVKEVVWHLQNGAHKKETLIGIAYDCGFNSKATFNRSFRKVMGKTPKEYLSEIEL